MVNVSTTGITATGGNLNIAAAGLNHIGTLSCDGQLHLLGSGIVLVDKLEVPDGKLFLYTGGTAALFIKDSSAENTYVLVNPSSAQGILDESYTLPTGCSFVLPQGTAMEVSVSLSGDGTLSTGRLTVPASSKLIIRSGALLKVSSNIIDIRTLMASLDVNGTLAIDSGGKVSLGGYLNVAAGAGIYCADYICGDYTTDSFAQPGTTINMRGNVNYYAASSDNTIKLSDVNIFLKSQETDSAVLKSIASKGDCTLYSPAPSTSLCVQDITVADGTLSFSGYECYDGVKSRIRPSELTVTGTLGGSGLLILKNSIFNVTNNAVQAGGVRQTGGVLNAAYGCTNAPVSAAFFSKYYSNESAGATLARGENIPF